MRRKESTVTKWVLGVTAGAAVFDVLLQAIEHSTENKPFTWESYDGKRTLGIAAMGGLVGFGLGHLAHQIKLSEEAKAPFDPDEYLKKLLSAENLKADPALLKKYSTYQKKIKEWLNKQFGLNLVCQPQDAGSLPKGTAVGSNCDLDILLAFNRNSYFTLEEMFNDVFNKINTYYGNEAIVSKQTKAIGLTFSNNNIPVHIDIVPGREIGDYLKDSELNLYVRPDYFWQKGSSFKVNTYSQLMGDYMLPEVKRVMQLLRIYRERNELNLPGVIIDQCVYTALSKDQCGIYYSDTKNLLNAMEFIAYKLQLQNLTDLSNSNNNLNHKLTDSQREHIIALLQSDVRKITENPRYIKEIFH